MNALAYEACDENEDGPDRSRAITATDILAAREALVLRRSAHIAQLGHRLREDRVRRVIEPLLAGAPAQRFSDRDIRNVRHLGLIACDDPLRIANPTYREVVPRELTPGAPLSLIQQVEWSVRPDGGFDADRLLSAFQQFFREHSEHWIGRFAYREAGPQVLRQAFYQRILNGGGRVDRESGLGRGRTDLLLLWPRAADCAAGPAEILKDAGFGALVPFGDEFGAGGGHRRRAGQPPPRELLIDRGMYFTAERAGAQYARFLPRSQDMSVVRGRAIKMKVRDAIRLGRIGEW